MSRLAAIPLFSEEFDAPPVTALPPRRVFGTEERPEIRDDSTRIDWALVVALRREASAEIAANLESHHSSTGRPMSELDRRLMGRSVAHSIVRAHARKQSDTGQELWSLDTEQIYAQALENAIFGYGRLQPLFEIPAAENIEINGAASVQVQFPDGTRISHPPVADSDEELIEAIRFLGESVTPSRPFDEAHPTMTLALGDRFRLHAIAFGLSYRPSVTIRQHTMTQVTLSDLVARGMLPMQLGRLLMAAVRARASIVVSGDQGAGKTTLLRALIAAIPHNERFGTIETDYELLTHLQPGRENVLALQARIGMGERLDGHQIGEFTVADLIPEALRQNLTRLIVGEVRGSEAGAMFQAMQAGAGSLSTTHSHSAESTIDRLAARVAEGGVLSIDEAYRQIAHHLDLLVYVRLADESWHGGHRHRTVAEVRSLTGSIEGGRPVTHLVYSSEPGALIDPDDRLYAKIAAFIPEDLNG